MEFIILKDFEVILSTASSQNQKLVSKSSELFETGLKPTVENDCNNSVFVERLHEVMLQEVKAKGGGEIDWRLKLAMVLSANPTTDSNPTNAAVTIFESKSPTNVLRILFNRFRDVRGNIVVKKFGVRDRTRDLATINWKIGGIKLGPRARGDLLAFLSDTVQFGDATMLASWINRPTEFSGIFTISVTLSDSALCSLHSMNLSPGGSLEAFKKVLEEEICTDTQITVGLPPNQVTIKCNRVFLAAGSPVFRRMFESGMKESTGNKIEMEGISEMGVRALLAYFYHRGIEGICGSSEVAVEVLQATEKYDIKNLKEEVREIFMAKPSSWFSVDAAVGLFLFAKALSLDYVAEDDGDDQMLAPSGDDQANTFWEGLKIKSLKVLRWHSKKFPKKLMESAKYQEIFKKNPQLGIEVGAAFLQLT